MTRQQLLTLAEKLGEQADINLEASKQSIHNHSIYTSRMTACYIFHGLSLACLNLSQTLKETEHGK